jgi:hypothetical protein
MTTSDGRLVIRSYRSVFRFERRLYRFDRWRLPVRGGVPLRALLYAPVVYLACMLIGRLPLVGAGLGVLPDPVRWGSLPLGIVIALVRIERDGRRAHRALWAVVRHRLSPRWVAGLRPCAAPGPAPLAWGTMVVRPDSCSAGEGHVRGPVRVRVRGPARVLGQDGRNRVAGRRLVVEVVEHGDPSSGARVISVPVGGVLELRCARR